MDGYSYSFPSPPSDIEDLTRKTGNFKQFPIFCSMLESAVRKVRFGLTGLVNQRENPTLEIQSLELQHLPVASFILRNSILRDLFNDNVHIILFSFKHAIH